MRFKQCVETLCQGSTKAPHLRRQRSGLTRDVEADDGQGLSHTISIVQKRTSRCETGHRQQQQAAASSSKQQQAAASSSKQQAAASKQQQAAASFLWCASAAVPSPLTVPQRAARSSLYDPLTKQTQEKTLLEKLDINSNIPIDTREKVRHRDYASYPLLKALCNKDPAHRIRCVI